MIRSELGDSLEHLKAAAGHAAGGVNTAVRPRVDAARDFVVPSATRVRDAAGSGWESTVSSVVPLAASAGHKTRHAAKAVRRSKGAKSNGKRAEKLVEASSSRRWPIVAAIVVAGAAFGAAAIMRRKRQQQWDEYDPSRSLDAARSSTGGAGGGGRGHSHGRIGDAADAAKSSVRSAAATAKDAAATAKSRLSSSSSSTTPQTTDPTASSEHLNSPNGRN
ncbi:hypothetical protein O7635_09285 [Asanoa sp. WMMD1127]|uniref:hypothetical protein n=1 Tax=Asanoa sp. WMMD1127 TaxID=3016107 RepID=UPI002416DAFE|nr:hypothetical protein [Asanoa sp. WMMD1127]MDG4822044.1 hypothetical protein [Asanoa sp. WMMD1127]